RPLPCERPTRLLPRWWYRTLPTPTGPYCVWCSPPGMLGESGGVGGGGVVEYEQSVADRPLVAASSHCFSFWVAVAVERPWLNWFTVPTRPPGNAQFDGGVGTAVESVQSGVLCVWSTRAPL